MTENCMLDGRKKSLLMDALNRIMVRHHSGKCALDEPAFELFEIAKRAYRAQTLEELYRAVDELVDFTK